MTTHKAVCVSCGMLREVDHRCDTGPICKDCTVLSPTDNLHYLQCCTCGLVWPAKETP